LDKNWELIDIPPNLMVYSIKTYIDLHESWWIFSTPAPRRRRNHGHSHYTSPILHDVSLNDPVTIYTEAVGYASH